MLAEPAAQKWLKFQAYDADSAPATFQLNNGWTGRTEFVQIGELIPGTPYRLSKFHEDGGRSTLEVVHKDTKVVVTLPFTKVVHVDTK